MLAHKILSNQVTLSTILRDIDRFVEKESPSKIRAQNRTLVIKDLNTADRLQLVAFAKGLEYHKSILFRNIAFFHPGDLTECSNVIHQESIKSVLSHLLESYGYTEEQVDIFYMYIFTEIFQNARRKQIKSIFTEFSVSKLPELSREISKIEAQGLIPNKLKLKIKIERMTEGFSLKIYSPAMNYDENRRLNSKLKARVGFSSKIEPTKEEINSLMEDAEGSGLGIFTIKRVLHSIHPGYHLSIKNDGKYAVAEVTLPKLDNN